MTAETTYRVAIEISDLFFNYMPTQDAWVEDADEKPRVCRLDDALLLEAAESFVVTMRPFVDKRNMSGCPSAERLVEDYKRRL